MNVEVQALEPGMCLSHDVEARGRVLFKAGLPLSEKHIGMLVRWEIECVEVAGDEGPPSRAVSISPESRLNNLRELAVPFEQDPQMQLLLASVHMVLEERVD